MTIDQPIVWVMCHCYVHPVSAWSEVHRCGRCRTGCMRIDARNRAEAERHFLHMNGVPVTPIGDRR